MNPSHESNDGDTEFRTVIAEELSERGDVTQYRITESSATHVCVVITRQTEDGERQFLYQIDREPRPGNSYHVHWTYLGPVTEDG